MSEISSDFYEAWRRFLAAEYLRLLHETQEWEWTRGRTDYVAFLIAVNDEAVLGHMARVIARIEDIPGIDPYPERYWHVTVKGLGFMTDTPGRLDELSPRDVQRFTEEARPIIEAVSPFELTIGPVSAFPEVVILEVHDGGQVRELNTRLLDRVPGLLRYEIDGSNFLPHVSIARFVSDEGLSALKDSLSGLRAEAERSSFRAEEVLLVRAHLAAEAPRLEVLATYRLGS